MQYGNLVGKVQIPVTLFVGDHTMLTNRDAPEQHPIGAISGLEDELSALNGAQEEIKVQLEKVDETEPLTNTDIENILGGFTDG